MRCSVVGRRYCVGEIPSLSKKKAKLASFFGDRPLRHVVDTFFKLSRPISVAVANWVSLMHRNHDKPTKTTRCAGEHDISVKSERNERPKKTFDIAPHHHSSAGVCSLVVVPSTQRRAAGIQHNNSRKLIRLDEYNQQINSIWSVGENLVWLATCSCIKRPTARLV
jgi:hypothetical protein